MRRAVRSRQKDGRRPPSGRAIAALLAGLALFAHGAAQAQARIAEWVERNPGGDPDRIALGYPVPLPVDTPLPFDGFRSYAALHLRHQDLELTTSWVHGEIVGETRTGRPIRAYRLGDVDRLTPWGVPEAATLTNGGIHAREWQSPETVTGILELLATAPEDRHFYEYLREQVNMVVIPVLNIDGFLQTQRYPTRNYLGTDPGNPLFWPRDGRMRRKNMLMVDENLNSQGDHLGGVDLNRNNMPFWASSNRSSDDLRSLVHHGAGPASEPEIRALDQAAQLGPADRLRIYTDVHSFSQVHFWIRNRNERLAIQTENVLNTFSRHHQAFPAGKWYQFGSRRSVANERGIGTTDEYFTMTYQVPSWTLEIEPSGGQSFHAPLPGGGADYGGEGVNGHDGFILPEREIRRVREQLAQSFAAVYYRQSGPPNVQEVRILDAESGALIYEAAWDPAPGSSRALFAEQLQPLEPGRVYRLWIAFNKPMRWLQPGPQVTPPPGTPPPELRIALFPGQPIASMTRTVELYAGDTSLEVTRLADAFPLESGGAPDGYRLYATDSWQVDLRIEDTPGNRALIDAEGALQLALNLRDMTNLGLDADPGTVADWADGHWIGYEDSEGLESDRGGTDATLQVQASTTQQETPFTLEPGISTAWFDPDDVSEGFVMELLSDGRAVAFWFTYDEEGRQEWLMGVGTVRGNRAVFPEIVRTTGGRFGQALDPAEIEQTPVGSMRFTWTGCYEGRMDWHLDNRRGRKTLQPLGGILGLDCGIPTPGAPVPEYALRSGSWADPDTPGQGFVVHVLDDTVRAAVYWFTADLEGTPRWIVGVGERQEDGRWWFPELEIFDGRPFGSDTVPERRPWGTLELDLDCGGGLAEWVSDEPGFEAGSLEILQLTSPAPLGCP